MPEADAARRVANIRGPRDNLIERLTTAIQMDRHVMRRLVPWRVTPFNVIMFGVEVGEIGTLIPAVSGDAWDGARCRSSRRESSLALLRLPALGVELQQDTSVSPWHKTTRTTTVPRQTRGWARHA